MKKSILVIVAGLLVIGLLCGAGAAALNEEDTIHIFDKDTSSGATPNVDAKYETIGRHLVDAAQNVIAAGNRWISTVAGESLENLKDMVGISDDQEKVKKAGKLTHYENDSATTVKVFETLTESAKKPIQNLRKVISEHITSATEPKYITAEIKKKDTLETPKSSDSYYQKTVDEQENDVIYREATIHNINESHNFYESRNINETVNAYGVTPESAIKQQEDFKAAGYLRQNTGVVNDINQGRIIV